MDSEAKVSSSITLNLAMILVTLVVATRPISPRKVVFWKGNCRLFQRNVGWWNTRCWFQNIVYFHPENWGSIFTHFDGRIFFRWVGEKPPSNIPFGQTMITTNSMDTTLSKFLGSIKIKLFWELYTWILLASQRNWSSLDGENPCPNLFISCIWGPKAAQKWMQEGLIKRIWSPSLSLKIIP